MTLLTLTFILVLLVSFGAIALLTRPSKLEKTVEGRLVGIHSQTQLQPAADESIESLLRQKRSTTLESLELFLSRFNFSEKITLLILHADSKSSVGGFLLSSILLAGAGVGAAAFFTGLVVIRIPAALVGLCIPYVTLRFKAAKKLKAFNMVLPDAIDLMSRALRAGHSVSSAIEVISEQAAEPAASEFAEVFRQQNFGLPFREALMQLAHRIPSKDLHFLLTAMLVQKETGGNLTEILDRTVHVIRERLRIEGEVRIRTAQGRLTGWILGCLPLVMLVLINFVDPGYSHILLEDPLGQKLMIGGAVLLCIGGLIIRKIVAIQV